MNKHINQKAIPEQSDFIISVDIAKGDSYTTRVLSRRCEDGRLEILDIENNKEKHNIE